MTFPDPLQDVLLYLLSKSTCPLKASKIAEILSAEINVPVNKKFVNPTLYGLQRKGLVAKDKLFRWSIIAAGNAETLRSLRPKERPADLPGPIEELRDWSVYRPPPSAQVGHWVFTLDCRREREIWRLQCTLCGFLTQHRVRHGGFVLPLTGNLRDRRRRHDRSAHPNAFQSQVQAENRLLGVDRKVRKPRNPGAIKSLMDALGDI